MHARTLSSAMSSTARGVRSKTGSVGEAAGAAPAAADAASLLPQLRTLLQGLNANSRVQAAAAAALSRTLAEAATEPPAALAQLIKQCVP
jgi:ABC-type transporter Mla subunit MlaD